MSDLEHQEQAAAEQVERAESAYKVLLSSNASEQDVRKALLHKKAAEFTYGNLVLASIAQMKEMESPSMLSSSSSSVKTLLSGNNKRSADRAGLEVQQEPKTAVPSIVCGELSKLCDVEREEYIAFQEVQRAEAYERTSLNMGIQHRKLAELRYGNLAILANQLRMKEEAVSGPANSEVEAVSHAEASLRRLQLENARAINSARQASEHVNRLIDQGADQNTIQKANCIKRLAELKQQMLSADVASGKLSSYWLDVQDNERSDSEVAKELAELRKQPTRVTLDIIPIDSTIDLDRLADAIRSLRHPGILKWNPSHEVEPLLVMKKLTLMVELDISQLGIDGICDEISKAFPGDIQAIDQVASVCL